VKYKIRNHTGLLEGSPVVIDILRKRKKCGNVKVKYKKKKIKIKTNFPSPSQ